MTKTVGVAEAKNQFSDLLDRVARHGERVIVARRGKPVGALVSAADLERLEKLEDRKRLRRVRALEKSTKRYIPLEEFVREYEKKWGVNLDAMAREELGVRD